MSKPHIFKLHFFEVIETADSVKIKGTSLHGHTQKIIKQTQLANQETHRTRRRDKVKLNIKHIKKFETGKTSDSL